MLIPDDPDIAVRVRKFADFATQGEIVIRSPVINRNGSRNVSGHWISHDGQTAAYTITPRVYWKCEVDGQQHYIRIKSKEVNLDVEEWKDMEEEIDFPLTNYAPDFLIQMANEELFRKKFATNPFWVIDHRYGPGAVNKQADAYKFIKRVLMSHDEYIKMMSVINIEWDRCYDVRDELLVKFLNDDKQQVKREKEFIKRLVHFLSEHKKLTIDISPEILYFMLSLDSELLKDVGRFIKRNQHDIPYMKAKVIKDGVDKAKVAVVMKS